MSKFNIALKELRELQSLLKATVNRLWSINISLTAAYRLGQKEDDFLPRRLLLRRREEQLVFEKLLYQFNRVVSANLDSAFIAFSSVDDVDTVIRIRKTIRYIQNAFSDEVPIGRVLAKLNQALPAYSRN